MKRTVSLISVALVLASALSSCSFDKPEELLTYRYNYDLSEYIDLADYKGLPAEGYALSITESDIEQQVLAARVAYSRTVEITDRGAQSGDTLTISYVGYIDGEASEETISEEYNFMIGSDTMPEEFGNALVGAKKGDTLSFDVTFPDPFYTKTVFSGKLVHFDVTVTKVYIRELPDYTDDFIRAYLGYNSAEEFEESITETLTENYYENYYQSIDSQIWSTVIENTTVKKFPEKELREMYDDMVTSVEAYAEAYGINFADYLKAIYGMTEEEFYEYAQTEAEAYVKDEMVKYAIARAEGITLTEEEYEEGVKEYALEIYEFDSVEEFEQVYEKKNIRQILMYEKVHEKVADYADVTYLDDLVAEE